ncbi:MAG: hypothetical protein H3C53_06595 [Trueperaceae bacterium]|nr:hypothetical protein [Trueperaceae bacterium]
MVSAETLGFRLPLLHGRAWCIRLSWRRFWGTLGHLAWEGMDVESAEAGILRLTLEGKGVSLETVGIGALSEVLRAITGVVEVAGGDPGAVSMVDIREGSAVYGFRTEPDTSVLLADVVAGMGSDGSRSLGPDLDAAIRKMRLALPASVELLIEQSIGDRVEAARLEAGDEVRQARAFKGFTTLYGLVTGVIAGKSPTARMRVVGDNHVVVMTCSVEKARVFGGLILRMVKVGGLASWDVESLQLQRFEVVDVAPFDPAPVAESLRGLADLVGDAWSGKDVVSEIALLRGDDE